MNLPTTRGITSLILALMLTSQPVLLLAQAGETLKLAQGTPVMLEFQQGVSSEMASVGDEVRVVVSSDVLVNGEVAIKGGAPCRAKVTRIHKAGSVGSPGSIEVEISHVQTADGQFIPVSGARLLREGDGKQSESVVFTLLCCILALLMKGESGVIAAGTTTTAYTLTEANIAL